jgi:4-amino-4-deoxy-L-arabinose transferase-like glycosyltransferase
VINPRTRSWIWAAAALFAGLLLRLWFIAHYSRIAGDGLVYGDIARNLVLHHTYGLTAGGLLPRPTLIRVPGYPIFLAASFLLFGVQNYVAVLHVQTAIDLLGCCLVSSTAARLFGPRAALPVLWIAALCPFTANYAAVVLTETLVLFSITLTFYSLVRWKQEGLGFNRWLWLVAAALSCGILLRPEQGLLASAVVPAMIWMEFKKRTPVSSCLPVLTAAFCVLLPLLPWTIRNWRVFHVVQPLAPASALDPGEFSGVGFNHWYRSWAIEFASTAEVAWPYDDVPIDVAAIPPRAYFLGCSLRSRTGPGELRDRTIALFNDYNQLSSATPEIDARFAELANQRIKASPICYYFLLPIARILDMTLRPRTEMMPPISLEWWRWGRHPAQTAFAAAYAMLNLAYLALAAAGLLAWRHRSWLGTPGIAWAMAASIVLRCAALMWVDISEPRFTLEFFPVLFVWAGALFAATQPKLGDPLRTQFPR